MHYYDALAMFICATDARDARAAAAREQVAAEAARRLQGQVQRLEREARYGHPTVADDTSLLHGRVQASAGAQLTALQQQWQEAVARQQALQHEKVHCVF